MGEDLAECSGFKNDIEWENLNAYRKVEKLMTFEALYISNLKPGLNTRDEYWGRELTLKILIKPSF